MASALQSTVANLDETVVTEVRVLEQLPSAAAPSRPKSKLKAARTGPTVVSPEMKLRALQMQRKLIKEEKEARDIVVNLLSPDNMSTESAGKVGPATKVSPLPSSPPFAPERLTMLAASLSQLVAEFQRAQCVASSSAPSPSPPKHVAQHTKPGLHFCSLFLSGNGSDCFSFVLVRLTRMMQRTLVRIEADLQKEAARTSVSSSPPPASTGTTADAGELEVTRDELAFVLCHVFHVVDSIEAAHSLLNFCMPVSPSKTPTIRHETITKSLQPFAAAASALMVPPHPSPSQHSPKRAYHCSYHHSAIARALLAHNHFRPIDFRT